MSVPYDLAPQIGQQARLGLILLSADETLEDEWHRAPKPEGVATFTTRISSGDEVSTSSLSDMEGRLTAAAASLPQAVAFDVVGYACTSASCVIGPDRVAQRIMQGCNTRHVTDPASALINQCRAQGITRLAVLSPYTAAVNDSLRALVSRAGIETPVFASFDEPVETRVARIDPASIKAAACALVRGAEVDGIFLSCTNLRTQGILQQISAETGLPAFSSNSVLMSEMMRLSAV